MTYAWFWQYRSWNDGSRFALTYSLVDRGTIRIDELEHQTGDLALRDGHFYSDKAPGQAILGVPVYSLLKLTGISHPRNWAPITYWWPDYVLTLATSGVLTASLGVLLYWHALHLGCPQRAAVGVALAYGLATPALPYATLYFAHQSAAAFAFASYSLLLYCRIEQRWPAGRLFVAGLLGGYAVATEYPLIFLCAALPLYAAVAGCTLRTVSAYLAGAALIGLLLAGYHTAAFGGPLTTGYSFEVHPEFQAIYTAENPTGLRYPTVARAMRILFSSHGLVWYAPIVALTPFGVRALVRRRAWGALAVISVAFGSLFLVNASHPTWTGGASTGPRYVHAALPFVMLLVAAALASRRAWCVRAGIALALAGLVICFGCTASPYGGRLPDYASPGGEHPIFDVAMPDLMVGRTGRNLGNLIVHQNWEYTKQANWASLAPLFVLQLILACGLWFRIGDGRSQHQ